MSARTLRGRAARIVCLATLATAASCAAQDGPRNIVLMIADGAGYNSFDAASMVQGRWRAGGPP